MATYVILASFTDQGIRAVKDSPDRLEAFKALAERFGASIRQVWYTVGAHDLVVVVDGTDEAVTLALLKVGSLGNVRTSSMRAFSPDEMRSMLGRIG